MPSLAEQAQAIANLYQPPASGRHSDIGSSSTVTQFLEAVGEGNYIETAARLSGLSKVTVYEWLKRGEAGESPFDRFANAVKEAEARAEAHMVRLQRKAAELPQYWAAAATHLERRHPDRWGKRQDDTQVPRVVVQIGVGQGEVKVGMSLGPSPSVSDDLHRLSPSVDSQLSPINRDYVNQLEPATSSVPTLETEADRQIPADGSEGDPTGVERSNGGQRSRSCVKGRSVSQKRKRAARVRKAPAAG